jgi:hypothetical protein
MAGSPWLVHTMTATMLVIAGYCAARLVAAWRWHRATEPAVDAVHIAMGVAMAGMIVPELDPLPSRSWVVVFVLAAAWFGAHAVRDLSRRDVAAAGHRVPHLLGCAAMLYMYAAMPSMDAMPGMASGPGAPAVAILLALALLGYAWQTATRLAGITEPIAVSGLSSAGAGLASELLAPRLTASCELLMGLTMAYALIAIL